MSFKLHFHKNNTTGLIAVCDVCGERIMDGQHGIIAWKASSPDVPGELLDYKVVCKGACDRVLEEHEGRHYWQELEVGLAYLLRNTAFDSQRAERTAKNLALFG